MREVRQEGEEPGSLIPPATLPCEPVKSLAHLARTPSMVRRGPQCPRRQRWALRSARSACLNSGLAKRTVVGRCSASNDASSTRERE